MFEYQLHQQTSELFPDSDQKQTGTGIQFDDKGTLSEEAEKMDSPSSPEKIRDYLMQC